VGSSPAISGNFRQFSPSKFMLLILLGFWGKATLLFAAAFWFIDGSQNCDTGSGSAKAAKVFFRVVHESLMIRSLGHDSSHIRH
jgi:hypothetical protein